MIDDEIKFCSVCGNELSDSEIENGQDICDNCELSIVVNPNIYPNLGDFVL